MLGVREKDRIYRIDVSPSVFLEKMKEKRNSNKAQKVCLSPTEIMNRKKLVDWMCDIGDTLKLSPETVHKAVSYVDQIMCENRLEEKELQDIALICMLLAGKLAERDPEVEGIISFFRRKMGNPRLDLMRYEVQVMHHLNWQLQRVTAMEFIQFFVSQGILFNSDLVGSSLATEQTAKSLRQYSEFFADLCLQEYAFLQADPLVLSAGIIAAARKTLRFQKAWGKELEALTTVEQKDVEKCANIVLRHYEKLFPKSPVKGVKASNKENAAPKTARPVTSCSMAMNYTTNLQTIKRYI